MFRTKIFSRNGVEAYGQTHDGIRTYTVTDPRTGASFTNTIAALVIAKANELADRPDPGPSWDDLERAERSTTLAIARERLAEQNRQASMLAGGAGAANRLSDPAARKLAEGISRGGTLLRGSNDRYGLADLRMLKSLARRGWATLDSAVRPTRATITKAGVGFLIYREVTEPNGGVVTGRNLAEPGTPYRK